MMVHQLYISKNKIRINVMLMGITFFVQWGISQITSPLAGTQIPLANSYLRYFEANLNRLDDTFFTSIKPYNPTDVASRLTEAHENLKLTGDFFTKKWLGRKLFNEDWLNIKGDGFAVFINPAINFTLGKDANWQNGTPYINTRGLKLTGHITPKFHFESEFYENQTLFPEYIYEFIQAKKVVPGVGSTKTFTTFQNQDFPLAMGSISYQPNKFFNFRFGHGKHFFGNGYRSLLLSDNAPPAPFFKIETSFWKVRYVNLWSQMLDNNRLGADGTYARKYVSTHFLSFNINRRLNIGFFETVIYADSIGTRGLDVNYLNPVIFYRPLEYSLNSNAGNVILGLDAKFKVTNTVSLYGQFILDEFSSQELKKKLGWWGNKFGAQIGIKSFNTLIPNLTVQAELNLIRPYTYSHSIVLQNYGHYNQPLAHPFGGNFREYVAQMSYFHKRWFAEGRLVIATQGRDSTNKNYGNDIYTSYDTRPSEFGTYFLHGIKTNLQFGEFKIGYLVNPLSNMRFEIGVNLRRFRTDFELDNLKNQTTKYFFVGLKTELNNFYHDF